ncbi:MAG: hypothetical protein NVSMB45_15830 [Ginsengibacter sp.]
MTHDYKVSGLTCSGCEAKVRSLLQQLPQVTKVDFNSDRSIATVEMNEHVKTSLLSDQLAAYPKYNLSNLHDVVKQSPDEATSWFNTYKPVLLIGTYLIVVTVLVQNHNGFDLQLWMTHFMAGFFLTFSFFKMLDVRGFADSYSTYDLIAAKWKSWGLIYPFVEAGLGILYLINVVPLFTNIVTLLVMGISIIGVLRSVLNHKKIKCACLGSVFNLPMSSITIIEDGLMILMSVVMIINMVA